MPDTENFAPVAVAPEADLLVGPRAIGKFLGRSPRSVERLVRQGKIPVFRFGSRAAATREGLSAWLTGNAERARQEVEAQLAGKRR